MTEAEWLNGTDARAMKAFVVGSRWRRWGAWLGLRAEKVRQRKIRLFFCACCRWEIFSRDFRGDRMACARTAIEVAERDADGLVSRRSLRAAQKAAEAAAVDEPEGMSGLQRWFHRLAPLEWDIDPWIQEAAISAAGEAEQAEYLAGYFPAAMREQPRLLREIFGNPFCPVPVGPTWLLVNDGAVVNLARAIYDGGNFEDLQPFGVLADALEDAGCPAGHDLVTHLRGPGPHVRGCWALDRIHGKG
jgi:hypothetical protein